MSSTIYLVESRFESAYENLRKKPMKNPLFQGGENPHILLPPSKLKGLNLNVGSERTH